MDFGNFRIFPKFSKFSKMFFLIFFGPVSPALEPRARGSVQAAHIASGRASGNGSRAECRLREPTGHCGREHFAADAPDAEIFGRKVGNFVIFEQKPLKINENLWKSIENQYFWSFFGKHIFLTRFTRTWTTGTWERADRPHCVRTSFR